MVDGAPHKSVCGHLFHLEVSQLLQWQDQVVYPEGLKGGLEPMWTLLSRSLVQGVDMLGKTAYEPAFLLVDLPHASPGVLRARDSTSHGTSTPTSPHHSVEDLSKTNSQISMTAEVQELLSCALLGTSSQASGNSMPRRPTIVALGTKPCAREEDSPVPATTPQASSQAATPNDTVPTNQVPMATSAPTTPPMQTPSRADTGALPDEVVLLQWEMNRAMGHLLIIRASIDAWCRKQVSDFKMALHQNKAETTEVIREARTHCEATVRDAEACCAVAIREAEVCCAENAHSIQQLQ